MSEKNYLTKECFRCKKKYEKIKDSDSPMAEHRNRFGEEFEKELCSDCRDEL
jgi:hypothetical protein